MVAFATNAASSKTKTLKVEYFILQSFISFSFLLFPYCSLLFSFEINMCHSQYEVDTVDELDGFALLVAHDTWMGIKRKNKVGREPTVYSLAKMQAITPG